MVVLVPSDVLRRTPSREAGIPKATEEQLRIFGVELIQRAVVLLRLPQTSGVSAAAIFQRFYFRRSLVDFDVRVTAAAALFLACKLGETHRTLRAVVSVFHRVQARLAERGQEAAAPCGRGGGPRPALAPPGGGECRELKQAVIAVEWHILRELGFAMAICLEHPHKYVLQFVKSFQFPTDEARSRIAQVAWNYLNDSMRTALCCAYQPHQIATASIYLAAIKVGIVLPLEPPWWEIFDAELGDLRRIARKIMALYARPPAEYVSVARSPASPAPAEARHRVGPAGEGKGPVAPGSRSRSRSPCAVQRVAG